MKHLTSEFERLIIEHANAGACWNLGCTTCGQMVTRGLFRRLDQLPEDLSDLDPRKVPFDRKDKAKDEFIEAASHCDMSKFQREATFPDWLGLLGVIMTEAIDSPIYPKLTERWGKSFSDLFVTEFARVWEMKGKTFDWQDLELLERPIGNLPGTKHKYRMR